MDELDLHRLADEPTPSGLMVADPRPVEVVLHRSRQIRRRRRGAGVVGAALLLAIVVGARALAPSPQAEQAPAGVSNHVPKLCTRGSTESESPATPPPPEIPGNHIAIDPSPAQSLSLAEASDLLVLPSALPEGVTIVDAAAWHEPGSCPAGPLLSLDRLTGDGTIDASIKLMGPYAAFEMPLYTSVESYEPITIRGGDGRLTHAADVGMQLTVATWTDGSGASWLLEGQNADDATVQAVAEALVLDTRGSPPADLPDAAVPAGWTVGWRAPSPPASAPGAQDDVRGWSVFLRTGDGGCSVSVSSTMAADPPSVAQATPDERRTRVRGQDALVLDRVSVRWNEPSGARVSVWCLPGYDGIVDLAESLAPVASDDPRIPLGAG